ncbi:DUF982 domain-containing protein [Mesorhizobium sp. UC22_110]|jgi:hypothetical protein|uniref:DUF982 domain-containing protein n=1 Tax=unclassified Mesorhizobium TaxID=325217 RepID=UPI0036706866
MKDHSFRAAIVIYVGVHSKFYIVSSVSEATDFLFENWATNDSLRWVEAIDRCARAGAGKASMEGARSAFLVAVKAAGMSVDSSVLLF